MKQAITGNAGPKVRSDVEVTLEIWEGMQHEWHFAANLLPEGRQAIQRIGEFVQAHLQSANNN